MRFVSPLLKHAVYPALHRTGILNRIMPPGGFVVVNYHGLIPQGYSSIDTFLDGNLVRPEAFRRQLQFLSARYNIIHPEDFRAWIEYGKALPTRALLITCDDGLLNTLDMLPILQSENVSCLFFVTGASASEAPATLWYEELYHLMRSQPLEGVQVQLPPTEESNSTPQNFPSQWWNALRGASQLDAASRAAWMTRVRAHCACKNISEPAVRSEKRYRLLKKSDLKQFVDAGMTIGAHTMTHPVLSLCSEAEARREIHESKACLEQAIGQPIWAFAYPFGNPATMGKREISLAREAGFSAAFLNVEHRDGPFHPLAIPRTHVTSDTTLPELAAHLSGLHNRLQRIVGA